MVTGRTTMEERARLIDEEGDVTPRDLLDELVDYYSNWSKTAGDEPESVAMAIRVTARTLAGLKQMWKEVDGANPYGV